MLLRGRSESTVRPHAALQLHTEQDSMFDAGASLAATLWQGADVLLDVLWVLADEQGT